MIYRTKPDFVLRTVAGCAMAVPVGRLTSELHGMIALSESGALLWPLLEQGADVETLVQKLTEEYDTDAATALEDVEKFLQALKNQGALL